jgi:hypothetical protein
LCYSAQDTTTDAGCEVGRAEGAGVVFSFGGDEEEDGAFGGGFNPGPGDETLVDCAEQCTLTKRSQDGRWTKAEEKEREAYSQEHHLDPIFLSKRSRTNLLDSPPSSSS